MGRASNKLPKDLLRNFDADLQEFYNIVIRKEFRCKDKRYADCIIQAVEEIVEAYRKESSSSSSALRFSTKQKRCAYILKHSPCFTSAVALHFMNFITEVDNMQILDEAFQKGELSICCLGGGPASEIVAISKILAPLYRPYWKKNRNRLNLKVTIVDINEDWKTTCEYVIEGLMWSDTIDAAGLMKFDFNFIQADLSKPMCDDVKEVIWNADILTMVYFVSAVNGGKDKVESFNMIKDIMKTMKFGGILFFLDSATDVHYEQMDGAARELSNMRVVYKPCIEYLHCLSLESVKKFLDIYKSLYNRYICMSNSFMSYCVWHKSEKTVDNEKEQIKNKWALKNNKELTEKMKSYRREVNELCIRELGVREPERRKHWRDDESKKFVSSENWREKGATKLIEPENSKDRTDNISGGNSNRSAKYNPESILANNTNMFDEQNQCGLNRNKTCERSANWRKIESPALDESENWRRIESPKLVESENWRRIESPKLVESENWRRTEPQKPVKSENWRRRIELPNLDESENLRKIESQKFVKPENWRDRNDSAFKINSSYPEKWDPQLNLTNKTKVLDDRKMYEISHLVPHYLKTQLRAAS